MARATRSAAVAATAAAATRLTLGLLRARPPGGASRWDRTNHAGDRVSLVEGPAATAGVVAGTLLADGLDRRTRVVTAAALAAVGAVGAYDDLYGVTATKGLRGHLRALAQGQVTSGAVKVIVIGAAAVVAARAVRAERGQAGSALGTLADGALVAGTANLLNLLDLRPGRALKVALVAGPFVPPVLGAAGAALPADLGAETMLGDCGANTLGAAIALAMVGGAPRPARWAGLGIVVGLTLASERVSFTEVIDDHQTLARLDRWGRVGR